MINWRLYRMAIMPCLLALAIAAFSLQSRPAPLSSTLAPDAFDGARAFAELPALAARYPSRRPGSAGDEALARYVARTLDGLGGTAGGGFSVRSERVAGQTIDGRRSLTTVIAERPGSTNASPIVVVAHRDAASARSQAELSGTAVLLELARVFSERETKRTIILVSTSGGSGGDAGAAQLRGALGGPPDAAIVLGDLAGRRLRRPLVLPYSDGYGSAPLELQRTVSTAIRDQAGLQPGGPSLFGEFAHLAVPLAVGEQGVLGAQGIPAVLVQASGEGGPTPAEPVSAERLESLGRAVLNAVDALDTAPDVAAAPQASVTLQHKTVPAWAIRLLAATLLLGPLLLVIDGLARLRRRRMPVGRWALWTLSCALPFFACALLARVLGWLGAIAAPPVPAEPASTPFVAAAASALAALLVSFALGWRARSRLVRRLRGDVRADPQVAGLAMLLVLIGVGFLAWLFDPYTALLLIPAAHLWLLLASPERRPRRAGSLALVAVGAGPLLLLIAFYAHQLGLGLTGIPWTAVLLLAGGHIGLAGASLWSVALGCAVVAGMVALSPPAPQRTLRPGRDREITIRGPLTYAGPGSLGGTESALRR